MPFVKLMPRTVRPIATPSIAAALAILLPTSACEKPLVQVVPAKLSAVEATTTSVEPGVVKSRNDSTLSTPASGRIVEVFHKQGDRLKTGEAIIRLENDLERTAVEEWKSEVGRLETLKQADGAAAVELERAKYILERAQVNYERTFIRAPFPGLLVELNAHLGEMSYGSMPLNMMVNTKGGTPQESMARVIDDSQLFVEADIDEADAGRLRLGQKARVTVEALGNVVLIGRLVRIAQVISTVEGRNRTIRIEIDVEGHAGAGSSPSNGGPGTLGLLVGMSADIEVILDRAESVVSVPTLVVLEGDNEKEVYVVEAGKLARRRVQTGVASWTLTEIKDGLRAGELVVIPTDRSLLVEGREVRAELRDKAGDKPGEKAVPAR